MNTRALSFGGGLALVLGLACSLQAHTISLGFLNSGPGSVTFWGGSYHSVLEGANSEGSIDLGGALGTVYGPVNQSFAGGIVSVKPAGLVDGFNNFYANNNSDPSGLMVDTNTTGLPVSIWQSVTFTGLVPGNYQFDFNDLNTTVRFAAWDGSLSTVFQLSGEIVNPDPTPSLVPEPTTVLLVGAGLALLALRRRRGSGTGCRP